MTFTVLALIASTILDALAERAHDEREPELEEDLREHERYTFLGQ